MSPSGHRIPRPLWRTLAGCAAGLATLLATVTPATAAPTATPTPLSLADAVAAALANAPGLRQAQTEARAARAQVDGVRARFGPTVDVDGKLLLWNDASTLTVVDPSSIDLSSIPAPFDTALAGVLSAVGDPIPLRDQVTGEINVTVVQPLTDLYRVDRGVRLAEAGAAAADVQLDLARRELVYTVTETYLGLVAARELTAVAADAERVIAAHVSDAERLASAGLVSDAQVLAARAELARAHGQRVQADSGVALLTARLAQLVAPDGDLAPVPTHTHLGPVDAPLLTRDAARDHAAAHRDELRLLDHARDAQRARADLATWERVPRVAAVARYTHSGGVSLNPDDSVFIGATLTWRAFDWGAREADIDAADLALDALNDRRSAVAHDLRLQVEQRWLALDAARAHAVAAEAAVTAAVEGQRAARAAFAVGEAASTEVLDAEVRLSGARATLVEARARGQIALAALRLALGPPYLPTSSDDELAPTPDPVPAPQEATR